LFITTAFEKLQKLMKHENFLRIAQVNCARGFRTGLMEVTIKENFRIYKKSNEI